MQHQRVEDLGVQSGRLAQRIVPPVDRVRQSSEQHGSAVDVLAQMRHAEGDVARFVLRGQPAHRCSDRIGRVSLEEPKQREKVPSPSTESRNDAVAKSGSSTSVCSDAWPPAVESPSSVRFSSARR